MDEALLMVSVQETITSAVRKFCSNHAYLDQTELVQEAQIPALHAIRSYKKGKTSLGVYVFVCVKNWLIAKSRSKEWVRRFSKSPHQGLVMEPKEKQRFSLEKLLLEVSEEAKQAIKLALELECSKKELTKTLYSASIEFCWEKEQIKRVWEEVREAINS